MSVKSVEYAFASPITWYVSVAFKVGSSMSDSEDRPSSANKSTKAWLVGANTVNGAGEVPKPVLSTEAKSVVRSCLVNADSKTPKFLSA